ncbi:murein L,D-transpeptidase catalytic domain family protein [Sphingomonas jatrophae]|uniref:Tat (Twin-arginine translocation) pathway signal sequence n=1 Tax=Sphingomonas jatrophae TaxID=1166337 RepID=A0A1I6K2V9_9SPHN|nr:murein L,D-transpeptidase catalytic domain family protein [Sphingomonas jatrophae]SFR85583.1 Tat (twin-arginine translocation) pathway signal sequence [Sphingomonas jatrophae]
MGDRTNGAVSRRGFLGLGTLGAAGLVAGSAFAETPLVLKSAADQPAVRPALLARARAALQAHAHEIPNRDLIAIADFARASRDPRFHLVDMMNGRTTTLLVAHGRGSDPDHSGWVRRFSNDVGSAASSEGAYRTGALYVGKHGRSRRLDGLDETNDNALQRAVVVHAAWYVGPEMVRDHGKLGRSEGCFAVSESELELVLGRLGEGRMIYAAKA